MVTDAEAIRGRASKVTYRDNRGNTRTETFIGGKRVSGGSRSSGSRSRGSSSSKLNTGSETIAVTLPLNEGGTQTITKAGQVTIRDKSGRLVDRYKTTKAESSDFLRRGSRSIENLRLDLKNVSESRESQINRLLKSPVVTEEGKKELREELRVLKRSPVLKETTDRLNYLTTQRALKVKQAKSIRGSTTNRLSELIVGAQQQREANKKGVVNVVFGKGSKRKLNEFELKVSKRTGAKRLASKIRGLQAETEFEGSTRGIPKFAFEVFTEAAASTLEKPLTNLAYFTGGALLRAGAVGVSKVGGAIINKVPKAEGLVTKGTTALGVTIGAGAAGLTGASLYVESKNKGTARAIGSLIPELAFFGAGFKAGGKAIAKIRDLKVVKGREFIEPQKVFDIRTLDVEGSGLATIKSTKASLKLFRRGLAKEGFVQTSSPAPITNVVRVGKKAAKSLEDTGLYVSPAGRGQTLFLRVNKFPSSLKRSLTLNLFEGVVSEPVVTRIRGVVNIDTLPRYVTKGKGFEKAGEFRASRVGKGEVYITKRAQIGQGDIKSSGDLGTSEAEAVIGVGEKFIDLPSYYYTEFAGRKVLIAEKELLKSADFKFYNPKTFKSTSLVKTDIAEGLSFLKPSRIKPSVSLSYFSPKSSVFSSKASKSSSVSSKASSLSFISSSSVSSSKSSSVSKLSSSSVSSKSSGSVSKSSRSSSSTSSSSTSSGSSGSTSRGSSPVSSTSKVSKFKSSKVLPKLKLFKIKGEPLYKKKVGESKVKLRFTPTIVRPDKIFEDLKLYTGSELR